jgi:hypothetical protein
MLLAADPATSYARHAVTVPINQAYPLRELCAQNPTHDKAKGTSRTAAIDTQTTANNERGERTDNAAGVRA